MLPVYCVWDVTGLYPIIGVTPSPWFLVSVANKGVNGSENPEAFPASVEEAAPEREGRMDLSAG
jgi:hypothetical protein